MWSRSGFRVDQALQSLRYFTAGGFVRDAGDGFLGESQIGVVLGAHGAEEIPARGLHVLQQQAARARALGANPRASEIGDQLIQTLKVRALLHVGYLARTATGLVRSTDFSCASLVASSALME